MRLVAFALALVAVLASPHHVAGQQPRSPEASDSAAALAGAQAGSMASTRGAAWGSAAATFFLSPFVGGVGSIVLSRVFVPEADLPATASEAEVSEARKSAYREAYRAAYKPRLQRAVVRSVLITTAIYFAGMFAIAG